MAKSNKKKVNPIAEPYEATAEFMANAESIPENDAPFEEGVIEVEGEEVAVFDEKNLQKFNVADSWIKEMHDKAFALNVSDANDLVAYEEVKELLKTVITKRTDVEKMRSKLNRSALDWQKKVNGEAKRLTALILPIEERLKSQKQVVDDEIERRRKEAEELANAKFKERITFYSELGWVVVGNELFNPITMERTALIMIQEMPDDLWNNEKEMMLHQKRQRDEAKRLQEEEINRQREELEAERKKLRAEAEELDRLRKEAEELRRIKLKEERFRRQDTLQMNGFISDGVLGWHLKGFGNDIFKVTPDNLLNPDEVTNEQFSGHLQRILAEAESFLKEASEKILLQEKAISRRNGRIERILQLKELIVDKDKYALFVNYWSGYLNNTKVNMHLDEVGDKEFSEFIESESKRFLLLKEQYEKEVAEQKESLKQQELAQMNDKERVLDYVKNLESVMIPSLKTKKYANAITNILNAITEAKKTVHPLNGQ